MTSICYFISGLCLQYVNRSSKKTKYKIPKVITVTVSWYSLSIICLINYATMAVLSVWHHQNQGQLQCPFLGLFSIQSGPFIPHRQEHSLKTGSQHVASAFNRNGQF